VTNSSLAQGLRIINEVANRASGSVIGTSLACYRTICRIRYGLRGSSVKSSEQASKIYQEIIKACGSPGVLATIKGFMSELPDKDREELKSLVKNPEPMFPHGIDVTCP